MLPLASVETISFGKPSGSTRIAAVPMAVPPPPPSEITPSILPSAASFSNKTGAAFDIATTHSPRSRFAISGARSSPAAAATSSRVMSGVTDGGPPLPTSINSAACPRSRINPATKACSSPFESRVPRTAMVFIIG